MNRSITRIKQGAFLLFLMMMNTIVMFAQDGAGVTVNKSTTTSTSNTAANPDWYAAPWVWIVGAAVFLLLLIALVRGSGGSDKTVTHRTTVRKDVTHAD